MSESAITRRLLRKVRVIAQHAETVSAMCRRVEREIQGSTSLGYPANHTKIEHKVRAIESRAMKLIKEIGIHVP